MAKRWKNVKKTNDFAKYESLALEDKNRYAQEKDVLNKDKKPDGPKKSKTGYMIFCDDNEEQS